MPTVTIPNRPSGSDPRSISDILENFDAILTVLNGGLDEDNFDLTAGVFVRGYNSGLYIESGVETLDFVASDTSVLESVPHHGVDVPIAVFATQKSDGAFTDPYATVATSDWAADTFKMRAKLAASTTDTIQVAWIALSVFP